MGSICLNFNSGKCACVRGGGRATARTGLEGGGDGFGRGGMGIETSSTCAHDFKPWVGGCGNRAAEGLDWMFAGETWGESATAPRSASAIA